MKFKSFLFLLSCTTLSPLAQKVGTDTPRTISRHQMRPPCIQTVRRAPKYQHTHIASSTEITPCQPVYAELDKQAALKSSAKYVDSSLQDKSFYAVTTIVGFIAWSSMYYLMGAR